MAGPLPLRGPQGERERKMVSRETEIPAAINITFQRDAVGRHIEAVRQIMNYRPAGEEALAATRVSPGVAAILTSTSLSGFSVHAWVT
jgi:hypothetical protein